MRCLEPVFGTCGGGLSRRWLPANRSREYGPDAAGWSSALTLQRRCELPVIIEFPRIDDRLAGMRARYGVAVGAGKLVRYDLESGTAEEHSFGTAAAPGGPAEAVFAPADFRRGRTLRSGESTTSDRRR